MAKNFDEFKKMYFNGDFDEADERIAKDLKNLREKIPAEDDEADVAAIGRANIDYVVALIGEYHKWVNS